MWRAHVFPHANDALGPVQHRLGIAALLGGVDMLETVRAYAKVDAETGEEVGNEDIIKGYQVDTDRYLEVTKDELESVAPELTRTIDIDEFVPRSEIDDLYLVRPYYLVPDGKVSAHQEAIPLLSFEDMPQSF
jgi:non-homologous end joining protein Ku